MRVDGENLPQTRRASDRSVPFVIEIEFTEVAEAEETRSGRAAQRTILRTVIRPKRDRDRRRRDAGERAKQLFSSLKSYLIAQEYEPGATN
jgi:hypothetical protein